MQYGSPFPGDFWLQFVFRRVLGVEAAATIQAYFRALLLVRLVISSTSTPLTHGTRERGVAIAQTR